RLDRLGLHGQGWVSDWWWGEAKASGILDIQNHSWDHNHPHAERVCQKDQKAGTFKNIDTFEECNCEVASAARFIAQRTGGFWPSLFAHPYGEASDYLLREYLPRYEERHRTTAAFGASGGFVTAHSERWNLERFVCGNRAIGWETPEQLRDLLLMAA